MRLEARMSFIPVRCPDLDSFDGLFMFQDEKVDRSDSVEGLGVLRLKYSESVVVVLEVSTYRGEELRLSSHARRPRIFAYAFESASV